MTDLPTLKSLQQRIREATGPDRELDALIYEALTGNCAHVGAVFFCAKCGGKDISDENRKPAYTLDPDGLGPCVVLMREMDATAQWVKYPSGTFDVLDMKGWCASASVPLANDCLTFLDAIFSAAIAQEEAKEKADV